MEDHLGRILLFLGQQVLHRLYLDPEVETDYRDQKETQVSVK